jgi:hypothetical protein
MFCDALQDVWVVARTAFERNRCDVATLVTGSHPFITLQMVKSDKVQYRGDLHPETSCALQLVENLIVTTVYSHVWKIDRKSAKTYSAKLRR